MRSGTIDGHSNTAVAAFPICAACRYAGRKFVATKGHVHFDAGETLVTVRVQIIEDDVFDTTLEFGASLDAPQDCTPDSPEPHAVCCMRGVLGSADSKEYAAVRIRWRTPTL